MGYDSFGLKIGIEGEREFKNALKEINQSFKVLGSEMNLVTSQFDKQDKSIQAITARNNVLNKEIEAQKEKISPLHCQTIYYANGRFRTRPDFRPG
jgi:phage-related minor tail protein